MRRWLDVIGSALLLLGLALLTAAVTMLAGCWWGLLAGAVECLLAGAALCWSAARMEDAPAPPETDGKGGA